MRKLVSLSGLQDWSPFLKAPDVRRLLPLNVAPQMVPSVRVSSSILMFNREVSSKSKTSKKKVHLLLLLLGEILPRKEKNILTVKCFLGHYSKICFSSSQ